MTEYWKSYSKKFCEICKCWYADNKVSIERHETGDRHKAMVQQRLRESARKAKDKEVADHDLRMTILAMEQAARATMGTDESRGKRRRGVPTAPDEMATAGEQPEVDAEDELDPKAELREQKRKLKELKKKSKQSQLWTDGNDEGDSSTLKDEAADEEATGGVLWVQAETPGGLRYYWHIFNGETRWDQPNRFYTSEEYGEKYAEIAAKIANQNHSIASGSGATTYEQDQPQSTSSFATYFSSDYVGGMYEGAIPLAIAPPQKSGHIKREEEDEQQGNMLSKDERKRFRRERRAMAAGAEAQEPPEGLILIKREEPQSSESTETPTPLIKPSTTERPRPVVVKIDEPERLIDLQLETTKSHPLGPWIPIKKEAPKPADIEKSMDEQLQTGKRPGAKHKYDDLPEQHYGPGSHILAQAPAELLEIAEMDPDDFAFKQKEMPPATGGEQKKRAKIAIGFRRPASNSANKSLRSRPTVATTAKMEEKQE